ncbi:hypothetical protein [Flavobacterium sp. JP2137]|uniref:hypothetical protein n=1 Tax=Flavobacterium sp. JP2137 TaxID=3414510 RepID=UPI003D3007E3
MMIAHHKICLVACLLFIGSLGMSCNDKKELRPLDAEVPAKTPVAIRPFSVQIHNPDLHTVQEITLKAEKIGDFYKIENKSYKRQDGESSTLFSKSYLVEMDKLERVLRLLIDQVEEPQTAGEFSEANPEIISIAVEFEAGIQKRGLNLEEAVPFENALFELLDGKKPRPQPIKIPTH